MQSFESLLVVVMVMVILVIGILFYARFAGESVEHKRSYSASIESIELFSRVSTMQELICTRDTIPDESCIDVYKLHALAALINRSAEARVKPPAFYHYANLFGDAKIIIEKIYPDTIDDPAYNITIYARNASGRQSVTPMRGPFRLYDPVEDSYAFAVVEVRAFS